jgi:hypothetical protein
MADRELAWTLGQRVARQTLRDEDFAAAEGLYSRYPQERAIGDLLAAVLLGLAESERSARHLPEAIAHVHRALAVRPESNPARKVLASLLLQTSSLFLQTSDWASAEGAARDALRIDAKDPEALSALGFALYRQDRNREAAEALQASLEIHEDARARAVLERIRKGLADERGMTEQRLSHFTVRYDGDAHEDVGREILRALERHYSTLATRMDHQLNTPVPVILFSERGYYAASGAPAWAGGEFDDIDGRIRLPIAGLSSSLTPDMDGTLIHELTHAFIHDRSRGLATREIHEGLAQYMQGRRVDSLRNWGLLTGPDPQLRAVASFYFTSLAFVEYLLSLRGQGGLNDVLKDMGDSGDINAAFRQVYGSDYARMRNAFADRFRQQNGG